MIKIGVSEPERGDLLNTVRKHELKNCTAESARENGEYDVLLWRGKSGRDLSNVSAWSLVICSEDGDVTESLCKADYAVSCGRRETDTVTISSSLTNGGMAALRREIVSISGKIIEPCEIELKDIDGTLDDKIAVVSLKLLLDLI